MLEIALFGVGQHTAKFINIITYFGGRVSCLADNDERKIGTVYDGLQIVSPRALADMECCILISCIHGREIVGQLVKMGIADRLISLKDYLNELRNDSLSFSEAAVQMLNEDIICMDLFSGEEWGGAENWNIMLAGALAGKRRRIEIVADERVNIPLDCQRNDLIEIKRFKSVGAIREMAEYLGRKCPVIFINSFFGESFFAVLTLKLCYPEKVTIVSVIHNDQPTQYALSVLFEDWIDRYLCVSSKIKETLIKEYHIAPYRVLFLHQPLKLNKYDKRRSDNTKPLRVGIASRLVKKQKRCDLIPQLICLMEKVRADYVLNIAGDGELFGLLQDYVSDNNLSYRVKMLGYLNEREMAAFWKEQDVYINISEFEGTSLSMLEAMEAGCVPLVTDVSGVRDYVSDGDNGFIFDINDLSGIAAKVKMLGQNRALLKELGKNAGKTILYKCDINRYADNFLEMMDL